MMQVMKAVDPVGAAWRAHSRKLRAAGFFAASAILCLVLTPCLALADFIHLKNGKTITAKVVSQDAKQVVYEIGGGEISISASIVDHIEKGELPPVEAPSGAKHQRAVPPADLPLPPAIPAGPEETSPSLVVVDNAVDQARLEHLDDELIRNPTLENRRLLAQGYQEAATFFTKQGDAERAIDLYRQALKFSLYPPDELRLTVNLSGTLIQQTHYSDAINLLLPESTQYPNVSPIPILLGSAYYYKEDLARAIEQWKKAMGIEGWDKGMNPKDAQQVRDALAKAEKENEAASGFDEIQSIHFLLRYDSSEAKGLGQQVLDSLEGAFRDISLDLDYYPRETIVVLLYSKDKFRDITQSPDWVGALNDGKIRVPVSGLTSVTSPLAEMLKHELTHSFVHLITQGNCPVWFNEGLAQYEEGKNTATFRGLGGAQLARAFLTGLLPGYKDLEGSFLKLPAGTVVPAYAKSLAGIEYLRDTYGMAEIRQLLKAMAGNSDLGGLIQQELRITYPSLETEVASYIEKKYGS
jgi:tetratricopeptide (TPR) repeat protein